MSVFMSKMYSLVPNSTGIFWVCRPWVVPQMVPPGIGASAFLSSRPGEESHEIALFSQPQFRHVAFKVTSLTELKLLYRLVLERDLPIKLTADHGASLAFYFDDPDGNMIEVYWPTGKHVKQPCLKPLDLSQSDEAILASIATETVLPTEIPF
jgi:Glyoxalase/Bleomycin resistance protein/Dioxygenase superfamily